jgi:hypothetical protein
MKKRSAVVYLAVGGMIAVAQSALLAHIFVSCKPYKMLEQPSSSFYWWTGWIAGIASPLIAIVVARYAGRIAQFWNTIIPAITCPILFWILYRLFFIIGGLKYAERSASDFIGDEAVEQAFAQQVLLRLFDGMVLALIVASLLSLLFWVAGKLKKPVGVPA